MYMMDLWVDSIDDQLMESILKTICYTTRMEK